MMTRRQAIFLTAAAAQAAPPQNTRQATGVKIGEITPSSAIIWTRRTQSASRLVDGVRRRGHAPDAFAPKPDEKVDGFEGACPGAAGYVRLQLEAVGSRARKRTIDWVDLQASRDFTHQFRLTGLEAGTSYKFAVETAAAKGSRGDELLTGEFRTAPKEGEVAPVRFALSSCQIYCRMDRADGFQIYDSIEKRKPDFLLSCGDNVYYDSEDPIANSETVARYHWQRMYSLGTLHSCLRKVPGYWQKDDHDVYADDGWPGYVAPKMGAFTFKQGQRIFREQVPSPVESEVLYRRFRWGTELEVWLPDSRDFRSPNTDPDGPAKSIWGAEQKKWLEQSLKASTARWKFLINPNPIVGPDHGRKKDNHANPAFATEGLEFRKWLKANVEGQVVLMNGDRHWQYHSVDPETGVEEFGCGPASDEHAVSPSGGENKQMHRFLRIKGGFVAVTVNPNHELVLEHCDVNGNAVYRRALKSRG